MSDIWTNPPPTFLQIIEQNVNALKACLDAVGIRVWRYVDSQKVLFNCWPLEVDVAPPFEDRFAFLRDPKTLNEWTSTALVRLSDRRNEDGDYIHPLWHLVPAYHLLDKQIRDDYIESILVSEPKLPLQSPDNLIGVVCIDAPYANYSGLPETSAGDAPSKEQVEILLSNIREALRYYSYQVFREGLPLPEFDPRPRETRVERRQSDVFLREEIANLLRHLNLDEGKASIYLRAVSREWEEISLTGGYGPLYSALEIVEAQMRNSSAQFPARLFSYHAWKEFEERRDSNEPILFPGSGGDLQTYEKYHGLFEISAQTLGNVPEGADDAIRSACAEVEELSRRIVERGSFGVFPIRCLIDSDLRGELIGLVCIAIENRRNVFTWGRRQLIERFCRMVGRRHDGHIAPVLSRVSQSTHKELIASPRTLRKLLDDPGPLVRRTDSSEDLRECLAFVVSVDLRKSTELMLKVVPEHTSAYAAEFMKLCEEMRQVMRSEYGVFDKFTGDGVLAFFPSFFSGEVRDAGYRAIRAAERCHKRFAKRYERFWPFLISVPVAGNTESPTSGSVGLGIGIDYGRVRLVNVGDELTVVGVPVVYACRLSGAANACSTLLNQRAFDAIRNCDLLQYINSTRDSAGMKHESGESVAYRVVLKDPESYRPEDWKLTDAPKNEETWTL